VAVEGITFLLFFMLRGSVLATFILSFGKFWPAWQKKFTGDREPKKSEFNAIGYATDSIML